MYVGITQRTTIKDVGGRGNWELCNCNVLIFLHKMGTRINRIRKVRAVYCNPLEQESANFFLNSQIVNNLSFEG